MKNLSVTAMKPGATAARYLFAVLATSIALELRLQFLTGMLQMHSPFLFFYISLAVSAWYGGFGPGILATALGALSGVYYFMAPVYSFHNGDALDHLETATFVLTGFFISFLYQSLIVKQRALEAEMEQRKLAQAVIAEADARKDEFLATLAHELRNPLAPVRNALNLLKRSDDESVRGTALGIIERQVRQMVHLVDDLLDISRITQGKIILRRQPLQLAEVIGGAVESVQPLFDEKKQQLLARVPPGPIWVDGDLTRLVQIFTNILANASKYTDAGGAVEIEARAAGGAAEVTVRDSGIGIPAEMLPRVFNLFEQERGAAGRSRGGLGIGLNLVKRFAEMHGGEVSVQSDGPGRGSVFTVRLPVLAKHPAQAAVSGPAEGAPRGRRVLVVDDSIDSAQTLGWLLETMDCEVRLASDGPQALEVAREFLPHYIFLDIGLPGMDGYKVCSALRRMPPLKDAVIVAETGYGQPEDRRRSLAAGFNEHLVKPVSMDELKRILASSFPADGGQPG